MIEADHEFAVIVVEATMGHEMLFAFNDKTRYLCDLLTGVSGEFISSFLSGFSGGSHVGTGPIDARNQDVRRRSRVDDVETLLDIVAVKHARVHKENGALGQRARGLVKGNRRHIGTGIHRRDGRAFGVEIVMGAVGFIDEDGHVMFVGDFDDGL